MTRLGPGQASASSRALADWVSLAPIETWATYTFPYERAMAPRSFLPIPFPAAANLATAPRGVALDAWPPVLEYTSVSRTRMFTLRPVDRTWSRPPKPMS